MGSSFSVLLCTTQDRSPNWAGVQISTAFTWFNPPEPRFPILQSGGEPFSLKCQALSKQESELAPPQPAPAAGHTRKSRGSVVDASLSLDSNGRALFSISPGETEAKAAQGPIHPEQATVGRRLRGEAGLMSHSQPLPRPSKRDLGGRLGVLSPGYPGVPRRS